MTNDSVSKWTREVPRESGWYWVRGDWKDATVQVVELNIYVYGKFVAISGVEDEHQADRFYWYPVALIPPEG